MSRSGRSPVVLLRLLLGAGPLAFSTWAAPASAARCAIELTGESPETWLGSTPLPGTLEGADCARIRVEVEADRARVIFVTRDGRRAERVVHAPVELAPTLDALGVTLVHEPAPAASEAPGSPAPPPRSVPVEADRPPSSSGEHAGSEREQAAIFALTAGSRGGADALVGPLLTGSASLSMDRWELGVMGAVEPQYFDMDADPREAPGSALAAGVFAGRRQPLGVASVFFGTRLVLAALNDESKVDSGERGRAEMRVGSYLGLSLPSNSKTRFRSEFAADVVPENVGAKPSDTAAPIVTPRWALSLSLGLEFGG